MFVTSQHIPRFNFVLFNNHAAIFSSIISRFFIFSQIAAVTNTPRTHQSVRNGHQKESASRILCSWSQNAEHPVLNVVPKTVCWFLFTHSLSPVHNSNRQTMCVCLRSCVGILTTFPQRRFGWNSQEYFYMVSFTEYAFVFRNNVWRDTLIIL